MLEVSHPRTLLGYNAFANSEMGFFCVGRPVVGHLLDLLANVAPFFIRISEGEQT